MSPPTNSASEAALADEISQALHRSAEANCSGVLWLAVDAAHQAGEPLPEGLQAAVNAASVPGAIHSEMDKAFQPRWLTLNTEQAKGSFLMQDSIRQALAELEPDRLQRGHGRRIAGWLELDGDVRQAALHFGRQMIRPYPQGGLCLLRLHDPAVMWALWPLLSPRQQRHLLGPVSAWWLLDPSGQLQVLRASDAAPAEVWSAEQWADIEHIAALNQALRKRHMAPFAESGGSMTQLHQAAIQALRRARHHGITDGQDLAAFALHAITVASDFDRHPMVRDILRRCRTASAPGAEHYSALCEDLDTQAWERIRSELHVAVQDER